MEKCGQSVSAAYWGMIVKGEGTDSSSGSGVEKTSGFVNQHRCVLRF